MKSNTLLNKSMGFTKRMNNIKSPTKLSKSNKYSSRKGSDAIHEENKHAMTRQQRKENTGSLKFHTAKSQSKQSRTSMSTKKIYRMGNKSRTSDRSFREDDDTSQEKSISTTKMDSTKLIEIPEKSK
mmetsp:Transcript_8439/g.7979  ORF Transcript_8439/g.7979 Transcript_8439/m.7979 type:complete len:127 (+) Transcript_8439:144-524(+)